METPYYTIDGPSTCSQTYIYVSVSCLNRSQYIIIDTIQGLEIWTRLYNRNNYHKYIFQNTIC